MKNLRSAVAVISVLAWLGLAGSLTAGGTEIPAKPQDHPIGVVGHLNTTV